MKNTRSSGDTYHELALLMQNRETEDSISSRLRQNLQLIRNTELTPRQAELLTLYYDEGKSMRQIAREQGIAVSTVSRTLARAQTRLRRCLQYGL